MESLPSIACLPQIVVRGVERLFCDLFTRTTATTAIGFNLGTTNSQTINANLTVTLSAGDGIENLTGGAGNDVLIGNDLANTITGNGGDDTITGLGGNDTLTGGAGNDTISFSAQLTSGSIDLGGGSDTLLLGAGPVTATDGWPANWQAFAARMQKEVPWKRLEPVAHVGGVTVWRWNR